MRKLFAMTSTARYAVFAPLALLLAVAPTPAGAKAITFGEWMSNASPPKMAMPFAGWSCSPSAIYWRRRDACVAKGADDDVWPDAVFAYLQAQLTKHPELAAEDRDAVEEKVFSALWPCAQ